MGLHAGLLELLAILVRRQLGVLAEQSREEAGIVIADFVADGLDALAGARGASPPPCSMRKRCGSCNGLSPVAVWKLGA